MVRARRLLAGLWACSLAAACGEPMSCELDADGRPLADRVMAPAAVRADGGLDPDTPLLAEHMLEVPGLAAGEIAYNPALARHRGRLVAAFRVEGRPAAGPSVNRIAMTTLEEDFTVSAPLSWPTTPAPPGAPEMAEDPRLVEHRGALWLIYNASDTPRVMGPRALRAARIEASYDPAGWRFRARADKRLLFAEPGGRVPRVCKNWSPFVHAGALHLIYQQSPLEVLRVDDAQLDGEGPFAWCEAVSRDAAPLPWRYGAPRGGSPAVWEPLLGRFVAFFHSRRTCRPRGGEPSFQYLTGMVAFSPEPPFSALAMLPHPIVTPTYLEDLAQGGRAIDFVAGLVLTGDQAQVSFGRNDAHSGIWVLDRRRLYRQLVPVVPPAPGAPF